MTAGRPPLLAVTALALALAACGSSGGGTSSPGGAAGSLEVAVIAPGAATDAVATSILVDGATLAVDEVNARGGVEVAGSRHTLRLVTYTDEGDPARAASQARRAVSDGAVGIVEDGIGATVSSADTGAAGVPEIAVLDGLTSLPENRPNVFRLGVANDAAAGLLARYVAAGSRHPAVVHSDTADARDAARQLEDAFATEGARVAADREVAATAPVFDAELRAVQGSGADSLVVWGGDAFTAAVVRAARADGLSMPLFAGPSAESPTVRRLAGPAAEGLRFVTTRQTAESDAASFGQFEHRLAAAMHGPIDAGVRTAAGQAVRQPATYWMLSYDAVDVLAAAIARSGTAGPSAALVSAMTQVGVRSANGDNRGFAPDTHEGVSDDDEYIAVIHDNQFAPVKDEPLSASLPAPDEILADFH